MSECKKKFCHNYLEDGICNNKCTAFYQQALEVAKQQNINNVNELSGALNKTNEKLNLLIQERADLLVKVAKLESEKVCHGDQCRLNRITELERQFEELGTAIRVADIKTDGLPNRLLELIGQRKPKPIEEIISRLAYRSDQYWSMIGILANYPEFQREVDEDASDALKRLLDRMESKPASLDPLRQVGIDLIAAERQRQIAVEGWTPEHDRQHENGQLAMAAACYALPELFRNYVKKPIYTLLTRYGEELVQTGEKWLPKDWLWDAKWWKPTPDDRERELIKAGALIAAEIDRLRLLKLEGEQC